MSNDVAIIPFQGMSLDFLKDYQADPDMQRAMADVDGDVSNFQSFPALSIKGKVFTFSSGDDKQILMRPRDPGSLDDPEPATNIMLVILRANDKARTYYEKSFSEQADQEKAKPTCFSNDGVAPSDHSVNKQSDKCATCKWAVFGSAIKQDGTAGKGTRCASIAKLAVANADALDKPMQLRVPPTSLRPMRDAIDVLRKRNLAYPIAIMRVGFVPEEASPLLTFRPVGLLPKDQAKAALGMREDSVVRAICGLDERAPAQAAAPTPAPAKADDLGSDIDAAIAAQAVQKPVPQPPAPPPPAPVATTSPPPAPVTQPAPTPSTPVVVTPPVQAVTPTPTPAPAPATSTVTVASGGLLDELSGLIGGLDG